MKVEIDTYTALGCGALLVVFAIISVALVGDMLRTGEDMLRTEVLRACIANHGPAECREVWLCPGKP